MKKFVIGYLLSLALIGCGTITPNQVKSSSASSDDSVPSQYSGYKGWVLFSIYGTDGKSTGAVITKNGRDRYNLLVSDYRIQFMQEYSIGLNEDSGVTAYTDQYGNNLWLITPQYLEYYQRISNWSKDGKPTDTTWMKIKDSL